LPAAGAVLAACGAASVPAQKTAASSAPTTSTTAAPPPTYPLTGLPVTNPANAARPALSVKIDNVAGSFPQAGLDKADIVAEALVEGGLTRLLATYQSQDASQVGPIRSARPVDGALLRELGGGIFAYSGAATGEIAPAKAYSDAVLLSHDAGAPGYYLLSSRTAPHNVFSSTPALYAAGYRYGAAHQPPPRLFTYSAQPAGGPAQSVSQAFMDLSGVSSAEWTWSASTGTWLRSQNGSADMNSDGIRVSATNVVIMSVAIGPSGIYDAAGNQDPFVILAGSGPVWVLRNGQEIQGTWSRPSNTVPMTISGPSGTITLAPGTTWMELLPRPNQPRLSP
jgi:hypothetical protein